MLERGNALARLLHVARFDVGNDDRRMNAVGFRQDFAPGRDDEAVPVGFPPDLVLASAR
jgi:hypothetical protein